MSGQNQKFNSRDRYKVIEFYDNSNPRIELMRIGRKETYCHDRANRKYCLLGAREHSYHWHGIDEKIIDDKTWKDAILIIAIRHKEGIRIYQGPLSPIICNRDRLALVESTSSPVCSDSKEEKYNKALAAGCPKSIAIKLFGYDPDKAIPKPDKAIPKPNKTIRKHYQFNTEERGDSLILKELDYSLKKIGTVTL